MNNDNDDTNKAMRKLKIVGRGNKPLDKKTIEKIKQVEKQAFLLQNLGKKKEALDLWENLLMINPRSSNAHVQIGLHYMVHPGFAEQERGMNLLKDAFLEDKVDQTIPMPSTQGIVIAATIGRWFWERRRYEDAFQFIKLAKDVDTTSPMSLCWNIQYSLMIDPFPNSTHTADLSISRYIQRTTQLIKKLKKGSKGGAGSSWTINEQLLSQNIPGAGNDPFIHTMLSIFHLSFFYRADFPLCASKFYQIASLVWPELLHNVVVPNDNSSNQKGKSTTKATKKKKNSKECRAKPSTGGRKIRLGIASGAITINHSVSCDFKGVLQRLDRNKFDVTYIYFDEGKNTLIDPFVYTHNDVDKVLILRRDPRVDIGDGSWVKRKLHKQIEDLNLDILLYLDLTMSLTTTRMGMAKLATVQATTHGHPVTSGIPDYTMNYYISWEGAELPTTTDSNPNDHYTEELVLLPKTSIHQYYEKRSDGTKSLIDGESYMQYLYVQDDGVSNKRKKTKKEFLNDMYGFSFDTFSEEEQEKQNWYVNMQKPHKVQPEFDVLVCNILKKDDNAIIILHKPDVAEHERIYIQRLQKAQCPNLNRIIFVDVQPHSKLLALYVMADVVLDSYPAGGCTSTREVFELGKVVVTLPAKYLGGRWTYGYYQIINDPVLNEMVIASNADEFIEKAVALGIDKAKRSEAEDRLKSNLHKMYEQNSAVKEWEKILLQISPVSLGENNEAETCSSA